MTVADFVKRSSQILRRLNNRRPKWVNPLEFLEPELQNLFGLSYFTESETPVPTGWNSTTDDGLLPPLSSRQPKVAASDVEMRSPEPLDGSDDSGSERSGRLPASAVTRMTEESSDDDSDSSKPKVSEPRRMIELKLHLTDTCICISEPASTTQPSKRSRQEEGRKAKDIRQEGKEALRKAAAWCPIPAAIHHAVPH